MFPSLNSSLGVDIKLIDGTPHWSERGADSFVPFKGKLVKLGSGNSYTKTTIDCTHLSDYTKKTADDFFIVVNKMTYKSGDSGSTSTMTKTYDAETGQLSLGKCCHYSGNDTRTYYFTYDIYG